MQDRSINYETLPDPPLPPKEASGRSRGRFPAWLLAVALGVITVALYWPAIHDDFIVLDDGDYVTANFWVQAGLTPGNLGRAFATVQTGNWHPLTWLSLMLDVNLFGKGPAGFHFTNVALHAANVVLLFWLLRLLTGTTWRSALVAALFGWHPIHVESVAWISERKDVLSTFFGFLSLIFYTRYARSQAARPLPNSAFFFSLCCFALGLMSKPMLVTWPFVMLLLDYWPLNRLSPFQPSAFSPQPFLEKIPFFALAVAAGMVTLAAQHRGGYMTALDTFSPGMRVENALVSYVRYLGKLFWPANLAIFYPHPGYWPAALVLGAVLLLAAVSAFAFWQRRRQPFLLMGWLWFLGTLLPVIGLVQAGDQAMADRYAYIPSVGWLTAVVWGACAATRGWRHQMAALAVAGSVAVAGCLAVTREQLGCWRDSETLFRHALAVTRGNWEAHDNLGVALAYQGRDDEAIAEFQETLQLQPNQTTAHESLGMAYLDKGWLEKSVAEFHIAIRLRPDDAACHCDLGIALLRSGQIDAAISEFHEAIRLDPNDGGHPAGGASDYGRGGLRLDAESADAHYDLGIALVKQGRVDEAINEYQESLRRNPNYPEACNNLGLALARRAQMDPAIREFQDAIRLKPDFADAHNNLGIALFQKGQTDAAILQFNEALRVTPPCLAAQKNLALALAQKNRAPPAKP